MTYAMDKDIKKIITQMMDVCVNPPIIVADQTDVEKRYWSKVEELKSYKKLFWKFYYKKQCNSDHTKKKRSTPV